MHVFILLKNLDILLAIINITNAGRITNTLQNGEKEDSSIDFMFLSLFSG